MLGNIGILFASIIGLLYGVQWMTIKDDKYIKMKKLGIAIFGISVFLLAMFVFKMLIQFI